MITKEFYSAHMSFNNENLIVVKFKDRIDLDLCEITKLVEWTLDAVKNKPFLLLIDARDILSSMDHESRKYFAEHEEYNKLNIAQAIVVNNMPIRLLATAYYKLYKHQTPIKIFKDIEDAKDWLFSHS